MIEYRRLRVPKKFSKTGERVAKCMRIGETKLPTRFCEPARIQLERVLDHRIHQEILKIDIFIKSYLMETAVRK